MQLSVLSYPDVCRIIPRYTAASIRSSTPNFPIVSAEADRLVNFRPTWLTFYARYRDYPTSFARQRIHIDRRTISWLHKERSIFSSQVRGVAPSRIALNLCERLVGERLHPPSPAPCEQNDLLSRPGARHAPFDPFNFVGPPFLRSRNFAEFDRRLRLALPSATTTH